MKRQKTNGGIMKQVLMGTLVLFIGLISYGQTNFENNPIFQMMYNNQNSSFEARENALKNICPQATKKSLVGAVCLALREQSRIFNQKELRFEEALIAYDKANEEIRYILQTPVLCNKLGCNWEERNQALIELKVLLKRARATAYSSLNYLNTNNCLDGKMGLYLPESFEDSLSAQPETKFSSRSETKYSSK